MSMLMVKKPAKRDSRELIGLHAGAKQAGEAASIALTATRVQTSLVAAVALAYVSLATLGIVGQAHLNDAQRAIAAAQAQEQALRQQVAAAQAETNALRIAITPRDIVSPGDAGYDRSDLQLSEG